MKLRYTGVLGACIAGLLIAVPAAAGAAGAQPVVPGSGYVALGDSVTFGYQEPQVVPAPNYHNASSFHGYPEQFGAQLRVRVANFACPSESSSSLVNPRPVSDGCENARGTDSGSRSPYP